MAITLDGTNGITTPDVDSDGLNVDGAATISGNLTVDTNTLFVDAANNRVGINDLSPDQRLVVDGQIRTASSDSGAQVGLLIGHRVRANITGTFAANTWYDTGITQFGNNGIYLLNAFVSNSAAGGNEFQENYIGWMSLPDKFSNDSQADNITTHRAGHAPNTGVTQFRTLRTLGGAGGQIRLQWLSNQTLTLDDTVGKRLRIVLFRIAAPAQNND
jgi:hypothetical protein